MADKQIRMGITELAYQRGRMAGKAEANRVWHDLRKEPNDLPHRNCEVVSIHENGNKNILKWKNGEWTCAIVVPVIAWLEIPKFGEAKEC